MNVFLDVEILFSLIQHHILCDKCHIKTLICTNNGSGHAHTNTCGMRHQQQIANAHKLSEEQLIVEKK